MKLIQLRKEWHVHALFPLVTAACFIAAYWPVFQKLGNHWAKEDNSYCYLILPLFFYLCWEKRNRFHFSEFSLNLWGLFPIVLSIGLMIVGELGSIETFLYAGIWGCAAGLTLTLYGPRIRFLIFPLFILLFIVPLPPFVNRMLTFKLRIAASLLATSMLRSVGVTAFREGNIIDIGIDKLQVVDACSGLRYLMPLILVTILLGYFFNKGWWQKAVLLLLVPPLSIFVNGVRVFATALLIINGHRELTKGFYHDFSGWLVFMIAAGALVVAAFVLRKTRTNPTGKQGTDPGGKPFGVVLPFVLTTIFCILFVGSGWILKSGSSARTCPERMSFESFPMEIGEWKGERSYLSKEIMDSLWADDYVSAAYRKPGSMNMIHVFIPFYEYQKTRHTAHAPQSCLIGGGWTLVREDERLIKTDSLGQVEMMVMTMKKHDATLLASYFFFGRGRVTTSAWLNKFYLMRDAITQSRMTRDGIMPGRTDGSLVRVELVLAPDQSADDAYVQLEAFISRVWTFLPQYVPL